MKVNSSFTNLHPSKPTTTDKTRSTTREQRKKLKDKPPTEKDDAQMQKLSFNL